jgi:hypothetical protein
MRTYFSLLLLIFCVIPLGICRGEEDERIMARAVDSISTGDADSAFMSLHALVSGYPSSPHAEGALFAIGEYYYSINDFKDANRSFLGVLKKYPAAKTQVFCYSYLLEIAKRDKKEELMKSLEHAIIDSKRLIFLFTESKEFTYTSVFGKVYKAVYYIDKVNIYKDGVLLTSVSY